MAVLPFSTVCLMMVKRQLWYLWSRSRQSPDTLREKCGSDKSKKKQALIFSVTFKSMGPKKNNWILAGWPTHIGTISYNLPFLSKEHCWKLILKEPPLVSDWIDGWLRERQICFSYLPQICLWHCLFYSCSFFLFQDLLGPIHHVNSSHRSVFRLALLVSSSQKEF